REHDTRMWRIFHHYVEKAMKELDVSKVKRIAIDETSSRRGHRYITLLVDVDTKLVLFAVEGKGKESLEHIKDHLTSKGGDVGHILLTCCDMSPAFVRCVEDRFPEAHAT